MFWTVVDSPIDPLLLVGDATGLRELQMAPHSPPPGAVPDDEALAPVASRAVGLANGRNPIAVIVPCHRVIGANGSLTGFGGGLPRKRWLLEHERSVLAAAPAADVPV